MKMWHSILPLLIERAKLEWRRTHQERDALAFFNDGNCEFGIGSVLAAKDNAHDRARARLFRLLNLQHMILGASYDQAR
jgi:hypothetical protein